eukprot:scaffold158159_cov48-Prasinocladus_malaysianus.AAC.1
MLQWYKRLQMEQFCRLYRIGPHSAADPLYLVPKLLSGAGSSSLDPRGAFVLHSPSDLYVWRGSRCPPAMSAAAERAAQHLHRYEKATWPPTMLREGEETPAFWNLLRESEKPCDSTTASEVPAYSQDFDMYYNAAINSADALHRAALVSAPSTRIPVDALTTDHSNSFPASPNERCRKYRRSENGEEAQQ